MTGFPDTRHSLLARLDRRDDEAAWDEFAGIYRPLVHRLARRQGLQDADAEELAQEALMAVAAAVGRWRADPGRGPFRAWLGRIAKNLAINLLTRRKPGDIGAGGTDFHRLMQEQPGRGEEETRIGLDYRREVFAWAAGRVRGEFRDPTWRAFWRTCVEGRPIEAVADDLGMSVGAVYIARSRVAARLRDKVRQFDREDER